MPNHDLMSLFNVWLADLARPAFLYQAAVLAACLALAYALAGLLKRGMDRLRAAAGVTAHFGVESLNKAIFPLLGWAIVGIVQFALADWIHTWLLDLALVPLFGIALIYLAFFLMRRVFLRSGSAPGLLSLVERVVTTLVWAGMLLSVSGIQRNVLHWMASVHFNLANVHLTLLSLCTGLMWVGLTVVVAMWAGAALEDRLLRAASLEPNLRVVLARVSRAVLLLAAVLISLESVGIDVTVLGVFGGALGVGLGLGLQKIASNYVSGFIILLERSLRLGDQITVAGYQGVVTQIRTRYTVLRGLDGIETIIPNEKLVGDPVQNHSSHVTRGNAKALVQIAYGADVDLAMRLLVQATQDVPRLLQDPPPAAYMTGFAANGIDLELSYWVEEAALGTGLVRSSVNQAIWRLFREHGVEIPYPQREVRLVGSPGAAPAEVRPDAVQ